MLEELYELMDKQIETRRHNKYEKQNNMIPSEASNMVVLNLPNAASL